VGNIYPAGHERVKALSPYRTVNTLPLSYKNQPMLYGEIISVCSQIHKQHLNIQCGQNVEFVNVTLGRIESEFSGLFLCSKLDISMKC
jgi:hypothetical protein